MAEDLKNFEWTDVAAEEQKLIDAVAATISPNIKQSLRQFFIKKLNY
jgi:hypothetical protein